MKNNKNNSTKKVKGILVFGGFSAIILIVSTYAWFIGLQEVKVNEFEINIASTDNLLVSLNGVAWAESISISEGSWEVGTDDASKSYANHTNSWGNGLMPVSSVGNIDPLTSTMQLFERGSYTHTDGGFRLVADQLENNAGGQLSDEVDGYVAFDLFIKNAGGDQYLSDYNVPDEEKLYLLTDSVVTVAPAGNSSSATPSEQGGFAGKGIENSVRVAFGQIGRIDADYTAADDAATSAAIGAISCNGAVGTVLGDVTGICRPATIWEPNETAHEDNAKEWFDTYCQNRNLDGSYTTTACTTFDDGDELATYAVNSEITSADAFDIYDGHNTATPISKVTDVDTFTDGEKNVAGLARPEFMTLAPNSITKVRIYVYLEGNDLDNMDLAAAGNQIQVNFGFSKQQLTQADFLTP